MRAFFLIIITVLLVSNRADCQSAKANDRKKKPVISANTNNPAKPDTIYCGRVETAAKFTDGNWNDYLQKNLNTAIPKMNGAPAGTYTVVILFVIGRDGIINQVRPATNTGYGMEKEAVRIIENSPKWIPATVNGRNISEYRKQPVTFTVPLLTASNTIGSAVYQVSVTLPAK